MKANPGGQIDLNEVVGRNEIIKQIWDTIDRQSIRINAERRIGKTTIIKKLCAEPISGWVPIFQDLEKCHTAEEFATAVYQEVDGFLSARQRTARRVRDFLKAMGGTEVKGVFKLPTFGAQAPWKEILTKAIEDLVEEREKHDERPLFLWDEVPYMLKSISDREGEPVAMEVLDTLRALRQGLGDKGLRMILTGSIGFHHVIHSLKRQSYANSPLNDLYPLEVPPLDSAAAAELAAKLIAGELIPTKTPKAVVEAIARISDGFPFYIHHIVKALKLAGREATPDAVEAIVSRQLRDSNDPWELNHFRERIPVYYGKDNESAVLGILDGIAARQQPVSVNELLAELKGTGTLSDREQLIGLLKLVEQDHYLSRDDHGSYQFRFPLLKRWWMLSRGL
ncbi:ATP-binding protein [Methylocaldum szegediense]|uniref:AAA domain-containing protein n=1 Tax=Methylocaldum szegediense TaxID=73780 RepID=A0ABN8X1F3_9GAMM|nr:hypothetical protein [Methylocaldum szegediense]CAI8813934.1 AAA domain-containing protein [Methylocaldum szegediense]